MCFLFVLNPDSHKTPLKCHPATHVDASLWHRWWWTTVALAAAQEREAWREALRPLVGPGPRCPVRALQGS